MHARRFMTRLSAAWTRLLCAECGILLITVSCGAIFGMLCNTHVLCEVAFVSISHVLLLEDEKPASQLHRRGS